MQGNLIKLLVVAQDGDGLLKNVYPAILARMVESVDAPDSKSGTQKVWGFKSLYGHQVL